MKSQQEKIADLQIKTEGSEACQDITGTKGSESIIRKIMEGTSLQLVSVGTKRKNGSL